ncbi:transposase [Clostridium thermarum]|uniref:transposase n=1 Tax=Clostridium thermarum TaxID=1716543 RepID=UPI0011203CD2|nr:transposase [Clostridium thermarum]
MAKGQKYYRQEFRKTIVEPYNSGKSLGELSSEYGISKSTINGWIKNAKSTTADKDTTITSAEYQAMLKKMARLEEENKILKKAMAILASSFHRRLFRLYNPARRKPPQMGCGCFSSNNHTHKNTGLSTLGNRFDECMSRFEFETYVQGYEAVSDWITYYNTVRIHSGINYKAPQSYYL